MSKLQYLPAFDRRLRSHALPLETSLLAMPLEEHKVVIRLHRLDDLRQLNSELIEPHFRVYLNLRQFLSFHPSLTSKLRSGLQLDVVRKEMLMNSE